MAEALEAMGKHWAITTLLCITLLLLVDTVACCVSNAIKK